MWYAEKDEELLTQCFLRFLNYIITPNQNFKHFQIQNIIRVPSWPPLVSCCSMRPYISLEMRKHHKILDKDLNIYAFLINTLVQKHHINDFFQNYVKIQGLMLFIDLSTSSYFLRKIEVKMTLRLSSNILFQKQGRISFYEEGCLKQQNIMIFVVIGVKRIAHKSKGPFSIHYIQRRNQMTLQYSEPALASLLQDFDTFISQLPQSDSLSLPASSNPHGRLETELLTPFEARLTLARLIEKGKIGGQRKNWKVEETSYLLFLVETHSHIQRVRCDQLGPLDWQHISQLVPNRSASACQFRYLSLCPASITSVPWSTSERQILHRIIQTQNSGTLNWRYISERLYELSSEGHFRSGKQCRQHYCCFLKPNLKKGAWTDEEDYMLVCLFLRIGRKWSKMTKFIEGRNENAIKNRFFLLFENRKDMKLSSPDLLKMVRRRKEKLEKTITMPQDDRLTQEEQIILTATGSDSSVFEFEAEREPQSIIKPQNQIFLSAPVVKVEEDDWLAREEFQRYIDL